MADSPIDVSKIPELARRMIYQDFRVALPACALNFDRDTARVTGSPRLQFQFTDRKLRVDPDIPGAPVIGYAGGGYCIAHDLRDGDPLVMLSCDGAPHGFYDTGNAAPPQGGLSHSLASMVAFPGGRVSDPNAPTAPANVAGECLVGAVDGSAAMRLRGAGLPAPDELGSMVLAVAGPEASLLAGGPDAADPVACANEVLANLQDLAVRIAAWVPVPNDGGASLKPIFVAWLAGLQPMGDLKMRVEGPVPLP